MNIVILSRLIVLPFFIHVKKIGGKRSNVIVYKCINNKIILYEIISNQIYNQKIMISC